MKKIWKKILFLCSVMLLSLSLPAAAEEPDAPASAPELLRFEEELINLDVTNWAFPDNGVSLFSMSAYEEMKASMLDQVQKKQVSVRVKNTSDQIYTLAMVAQLYYNTLYDYPEETFFARTGFSYNKYKTSYAPGETIEIKPLYLDESTYDPEAYEAAVEEAVEACFTEGMTDLEKVAAAHDWIVLNCQYDPYVGYDGEYTAGGITYRDDPTVYTSYGVFVKQNAVCQGYALAFQTLMNRVEIPCCFVSGDGHAWNAVQLDGDWYYVDATWDDPIMKGTGDCCGRVVRNHFLKSEATFSVTHDNCGTWSTEYGYLINESDYILPSGLLNAKSMGAYLCDDAFYIISGGTLQRYDIGEEFENGTAVVGSGLPNLDTFFAADVDWDSRMMYYNSCYTDAMFTYAVNMKSGSVELIYQNDKDDVKVCGLKLVQRGDSDVRELWTWYDYSGVDKILEIDSYTEVEDGGYSYNMNGDTVRIKREDTASVVVVVWIGDGGRFLRADLCTGNQSYTVPTGAKTLKILAVEDAESWMPLCAAEKPDL